MIGNAKNHNNDQESSEQELLDTAEKLYQELQEAVGIKIEERVQQESALIVPLADSIATYEECIKIQPDNPHLYFMLGNAQCKENNLSGAIASYQKNIELDPESGWDYERRASILSNSKRCDEAINTYQEVLNFQPSNLQIYCLLANVYGRQGNL